MESLRSQFNMIKMRNVAERQKAYRKQDEETQSTIIPISRKQSQPCSICNDAGFTRVDVPFGHPDFGKPQPCSCQIARQKAKHQQELVNQSGILGLSRYQDARFDTFHLQTIGVRRAYKQARDFAECPAGWLALTGPYGCGKTHLAVAIAKQRVAEGDTVVVQTVPDLLDQLRAAFSPKIEESFNEKFEEMRNVDLLVLDDYGSENSTTWAMEKLFQILNYRYNKSLPTVITSNNIHLSGIDPRVYSRLMDKNLVCLVKMEEARDYRIHGDNQDEDEE